MENELLQQLAEKVNRLIEQNETLMQMLAGNNEDKPVEKDMMDLKECAAYTGYSKVTIYRLASAKEIPYYKLGNRNLFKRSEIDSWLTRNRQKTQAEINSKASAYCLTHKTKA